LEGYANLEYWVAELDKRIELILLKRLTQIIQVWCTEFDRADDTDTRRDHTREVSSKRRSDKRTKDEKVCGSRVHHLVYRRLIIGDLVPRGTYDGQADRTRDQDSESSHLPGPTYRVRATDMGQAVARLDRSVDVYQPQYGERLNSIFRCRLSTASNPEFEVRDWITDAERRGIRNDVHFIGTAGSFGFSVPSRTDSYPALSVADTVYG